jgi:GNAT superfamily N-acetyltransferase
MSIYISPLISKYAMKYLHAKGTAILSSLLYIAVLATFAFFRTTTAAVLCVFVISVAGGFGIISHGVYYSSLNIVGRFGSGKAMGVFSLVDNLGQSAGPLLFGLLMIYGYAGASFITAVIAFVLLILFAILNFSGFPRFPRAGRLYPAQSENTFRKGGDPVGQISEIPKTETGHIDCITMADLDELVKLHGKYLNYGEGIRPHFESMLKKESTIALKYVIDGEMAGLVVYVEGIYFSGGHEDLYARAREMTGDDLTYTGDALLVKNEYRRMGISKALYARLVEELRRKKVVYTVNELWVYPDGSVPAKGALKAFGESVYLGHFENFYRDFHHYGYVCPICGKDCICSAMVYLCKVE